MIQRFRVRSLIIRKVRASPVLDLQLPARHYRNKYFEVEGWGVGWGRGKLWNLRTSEVKFALPSLAENLCGTSGEGRNRRKGDLFHVAARGREIDNRGGFSWAEWRVDDSFHYSRFPVATCPDTPTIGGKRFRFHDGKWLLRQRETLRSTINCWTEEDSFH